MNTELIPSRPRALGLGLTADPFVNLRQAVDRMLSDFGRGFDLAGEGDISGFSPRLDFEDKDDAMVLSAEVPGMCDKDVHVEVARDVLTIKGEKRCASESKGAGRVSSERSYGAFERTLRLPSEVNKDKISAQMKDGILTVTLPKSPEAKKEVKTIPVQH